MVQLVMKIADGGEPAQWTIVELQGELVTKSQAATLSGKFIGDLHFTPKGVPVLVIGHHILYGKVVAMEKPMLALVKTQNEENVSKMDALDTDQDMGPPTSYVVKAVIKKKLHFKTRPKPIITNVPKRI